MNTLPLGLFECSPALWFSIGFVLSKTPKGIPTHNTKCKHYRTKPRMMMMMIWAALHSLRDLSSPTRDRTHVPCIGRWILNLWTTREAPYSIFRNWDIGASLVVQWLGVGLPMQGTRVRALVWEDPTCRGVAEPMRHNYWACALESASHNYWSPHA